VPSSFPTDDAVAIKEMLCRLIGGDDGDYNSWCNEARVSEACPLGLSCEERLAIWVYSSTNDRWYERINRELRELHPCDDVRFFTELLNEALEKLPAFHGEVFRGMTVPNIDDHVDDYDVGVEVIWDAFTSSSRQITKAFDGNVFFTIASQNGRVLGVYADKPSEEEILFRAGSKFKVLAAERRDGVLIISVAEATQ
jgi:hypothetical protein